MKNKRRQGDVLIVPCAIPSSAKKLNHLVLAEGEVTGHKHQIVEGEAELYEGEVDEEVLKNLPVEMKASFTLGQRALFLKVISESAKLSHEEHRVQTIKRGENIVPLQREYVPGGWERVAD